MTQENESWRPVICKNCSWVHFAVDKEYVENWKIEWEAYWFTLDDRSKKSFGVQDGPPSDRSYYHCFRCDGPHTEFRDATDAEIPIGSTLQSILDWRLS